MVASRERRIRGRRRTVRGSGCRAVGCRAARGLPGEVLETQNSHVTALAADTNAYAALLSGESKTVRLLRAAQEVHLPLIVLGELLAGFALGTRAGKNREELVRFMASPRVQVLRPDEKRHSITPMYSSPCAAEAGQFRRSTCGAPRWCGSTDCRS